MKSPKRKAQHYNGADAKAHLSTLVRKALQGEEVIIARDNMPLARLVPVEVRTRRAGSAKGRIRICGRFDAALADFDEYRK